MYFFLEIFLDVLLEEVARRLVETSLHRHLHTYYVCAFVVFGTRAHFGTRVVWVPMNALPAMASLGRVAIGSRPPRNSHTPRAARTAVRASVTPDPVDVETAIFGLG